MDIIPIWFGKLQRTFAEFVNNVELETRSMKTRITLISNLATFIPAQKCMPRRYNHQFLWKKKKLEWKRTSTPTELGKSAFLVFLSTWWGQTHLAMNISQGPTVVTTTKVLQVLLKGLPPEDSETPTTR